MATTPPGARNGRIDALRRATRLLLIAALVGCGERAPTDVTPDAALLGLPVLGGGLVRCAPLGPDSASAVIGPEGGVIAIGPHRLSIPAGALGASVRITAIAPADTVNRIQFEPQGLTFDQPASLTMSVANCDPVALLGRTRIAYTTDALVILELLPSADDLVARTVTGQLGHFSDYAIAW